MDQVCIAWIVKKDDWASQDLYGVYSSREVAIDTLIGEGYQWMHLPMFDPVQFVYVKTPRSYYFVWLEDYELDA